MQEYIDFLSANAMLSIAWVVIALVLMQTTIKAKFSNIKNISEQDAILLMNKHEAVVVDVRTRDEFRNGHIINAKHIPLAELLKGNVSGLSAHKETPLVIVCASGARSSSAANSLAKEGFKNVSNLGPGMSGWTSSNLPIARG